MVKSYSLFEATTLGRCYTNIGTGAAVKRHLTYYGHVDCLGH
jgi:hypothetical protein